MCSTNWETPPVRNQGRNTVSVNWSTRLNVERLNHGLPLISADPDGWDNGFTLNPAAIRLERSTKNDELIRGLLDLNDLSDPRLADGVIAVFYRGIPKEIPGRPSLRSSVGLAVFTPQFKMLKRFAYPVVIPTDDPMGWDYNGVEDQRVTRIGDMFYMVYCGYNANMPLEHNIHICMAVSSDMVHWTKLGPCHGSVNDYPNKDAVIMSEPLDGKYLMLHRPMVGHQSEYSIAIATADKPTGPWNDLGTVMGAAPDPRYHISWLGAGAAPIPLGNKRYLADYHTGNYFATGERDYSVGFAVLNFNDFDPERPESIVESRCECVIEPETSYETNSPWPHDKNLNCVFPAGSCQLGNDLILFYGGADAYVLGARLNMDELVNHLEAVSARVQLSAIRAEFTGR